MPDITIRSYAHEADYRLIDDLLVALYRPDRGLINWLQPRWEYMHHHPLIENVQLEQFGVVEADGRVVGLVHAEHDPGQVYFQLEPGSERAHEPMLDWVDEHFRGTSGLFVNELDERLQRSAVARGYRPHPHAIEQHSRRSLADLPVPNDLPPGYRIQTLADDNDLRKVNTVLWRGFDHDGPAPDDDIVGRRAIQAAPNFRLDLTVVAVDRAGDYAAYAGMWVAPQNRVAYIEPVATDPAHRRLGLAAACVTESMRRAASEGADVVWVGSGQPVYLSIGFETVNTTRLWTRQA